jgi:nitrite reductase (NADH) large subunit
MGISRLIYGRSAMQGLYLVPDNWYDDHRITCWLNTRARAIDLDRREVTLGTGQQLGFDRLILAMGSSSSVPAISGYGMPGSFVLREAGDAINIRAYAQEHGASEAVIAGAGLLGLEAAYALRQLGLGVTVLERGPRLLRKQIDDRCSQLLASYLKGLGIEVLTNNEIAEVRGDGRVEAAVLKSGVCLPCDVFLVCAGIRPNADLARAAGLEVRHGVVVNDQMETSAPGVYAAGDVAELEGQVLGLWPVAVSQAEVAATNAIGGERRHVAVLPAAVLKGVGIDLTSVGRFEEAPGDDVIAVEDPKEHSYGKLVIAEGKLAGAVLLGRPLDAPHVMTAVKNGTDVSERLGALRAGDWRVLDEPMRVASPAAAGA